METQSCSLESQINKSFNTYRKKTKGKHSKNKTGEKGSQSKKSPKFLKKSKMLFSQTVYGTFYDQNCVISYDQKKVAHLDIKTNTLHILSSGGRKRAVKGVYTRDYFFSPDCTSIVYVTLPSPTSNIAGGRQSIWLINVGTGKRKKIYDPKSPKAFLRGIEWAPDGIYVYTIEVISSKTALMTHRLLRINTLTSKSEIVRSMKTNRSMYCFFNPPVTAYEYTGQVSTKPYQLVYATPFGIYLSSPDGKSKKKILNFSGLACDNSEWSPDQTQIALNFNGMVKVDKKVDPAQGVYVYRVAEAKVYQLYKKRDIHTLWWGPNNKYLIFGNAKTIWAYTYDPGDEKTKRKPSYRCVLQLWVSPAPADLTLKTKAIYMKKKKNLRLLITVRNKGKGKSRGTTVAIYKDKEKILDLPIPALEVGKEYVVQNKAKQEWVDIAVTGKSFDKIWVSVGMEPKMKEVSHKNNYVAVPFPPKSSKTYSPKALTPKVLLLSQVSPSQRITGCYWSKDGKKLLITAGRWLYVMLKKEGKTMALPLLQAPPDSFFARPKFLGGRAVATTYRAAFAMPKPKIKKRKRGR